VKVSERIHSTNTPREETKNLRLYSGLSNCLIT